MHTGGRVQILESMLYLDWDGGTLMRKDQYSVVLRAHPLLSNGFNFMVLKTVLFLSSNVLMSPSLFSSKEKLKWILCVYSLS